MKKSEDASIENKKSIFQITTNAIVILSGLFWANRFRLISQKLFTAKQSLQRQLHGTELRFKCSKLFFNAPLAKIASRKHNKFVFPEQP